MLNELIKFFTLRAFFYMRALRTQFGFSHFIELPISRESEKCIKWFQAFHVGAQLFCVNHLWLKCISLYSVSLPHFFRCIKISLPLRLCIMKNEKQQSRREKITWIFSLLIFIVPNTNKQSPLPHTHTVKNRGRNPIICILQRNQLF